MDSSTPKIHILVKFVDSPWGGANQFLLALREQFRREGIYAENPFDAQMLLFNSFPYKIKVLLDIAERVKRSNPDCVLVHRVDGPIAKVRGSSVKIDKLIYKFNELYADGTVFISNFSRRENKKLGIKQNKYETVILSACDPDIFNTEGKSPLSKGKIKLIASSWSANMRKGFKVYQYLDQHLDFDKYEMTFVGNSPVWFNNIRHIEPLPSDKLAGLLKESDIYITASMYEPFGQGVLEALSCGLPGVVRAGNGYLEITGKAVKVFNGECDVIEAIEGIAKDYSYYQSQIKLPSILEIAKQYYEFARKIYWNATNPNKNLGDEYRIKKANFWRLMRLKCLKIYARL